MNLISVAMSVFNESEEELSLSIESILNQTYSQFEFIVIVDNPENESLIRLLKKYEDKDKRIKIHINEKNIGLAESLNKALNLSNGDLFARMDADDISDKNRFEIQRDYFIKNDVDMVFSTRKIINEKGEETGEYILPNLTSNNIKEILEWDCIVTHPSIMIKTSIIRKLNGYRKFDVSQDYDLWLRMCSENFKIGLINQPLVKYRIRENALSQKKAFMQFETARFIRMMYQERKSFNIDSYSYSRYIEYLTRKGVFDITIANKYSSFVTSYYGMINNIKCKKYAISLKYALKSICYPKWFIYFSKRIINLKIIYKKVR